MNLQALMQQAQMMQKQVEKNVENAKKKLAEKEVHAEAGSGLVKVTWPLILTSRTKPMS